MKKVPLPTKRKTRKKVRITTAPPTEKPLTFAEARKLAVGQGRAVSAPTPAPEAEKPATRQTRRAWSGKYNDLTRPTKAD